MRIKIFIALALIFTLAISAAAFAAYERTADNTVPAYTDPGLTNRNGNERVDAGDRLIVFEERENSYYVRYPVRNGTKDRWVPKNVFNNSNQNVRWAYPAEGDYYIVPFNSSCAIDVPNNWHDEGNILQIYGQNQMPAQIFTIKRVGNEWYKIIHKDSGHVMNCQWGNNGNGTRLWLYHYDGTASCHWRFRDLGGGVYNIESQLPSNPFLEVQNGNPFNGAILQLWQQHAGNAAKWTLVKANPSPSGNWDSKIGQKLANENSEHYQKPTNPFNKSYTSSRDGSYHATNCTWYAWGRMREVTGKNLSVRGNAGTWHNSTNWDSNLTSMCVAERTTKNGGHVVFVEYVDNNRGKVYYTECNWNVKDDYKVQVADISTFKSKYQWFIH